MRISRCYSALLSLIIPLGLITQTQGQTKINQPLRLDPAIRTGKLANGFTYFIRHNEEPKHRVVLYLVNKVGSILEDEDQRGLAHFMEHMSFNGTAHFPKNSLVDYLQKSGLRFGADINAYTSFDETVYQLPIPSDKPELLANGLQIIRDWAQNATLDTSEINRERGVVLEEERLHKGVGDRLQKQFWPLQTNHSRYADRVTIGLDTVLKYFKPETIKRFYHEWYRPDLQAIIVVGDINADSIERVVKQKFGDLKNPGHEQTRINYRVTLSGENHFMAITDKEITGTRVEINIKHPEQPWKTAADFKFAISQSLFNQMLWDRFNELGRKPAVPFLSASAYDTNFLNGVDQFNVIIAAKPGQLKNSVKTTWREIIRLQRFGFTTTELDRAKSIIASNWENGMKDKNKTPSDAYVREYLAYFLKGMMAPGMDIKYQMVKKDLPEITLDDVNQLTSTYIKPNNRDILISAPENDKQSLPEESLFDHWLAEVAQEKLDSYHDVILNEPLLAKAPVPGEINSESAIGKSGMTLLTLSNGLKVLLKPTDFKHNEIQIKGLAQGGSSLYADKDFPSVNACISVIANNGAGNYNPDKLIKFLEGKQASVGPYAGDYFQGIRAFTTPADLEIALQLIHVYFTEPRLDTALFNNYIAATKASLTNRASDPMSVFQDTVATVLSNHSPRREPPTIPAIDQVKIQEAFKFYKERFADASNFTFILVGNVDSVNVRSLLEKYLGSLPATHQNEQARDVGIRIPAGQISKTVYKGNEIKATVLLVCSGPFNSNPTNDIKLDALKEVLQLRLLERLREQESGVYSPTVAVNTEKVPISNFQLVMQFGCAPQNAERLITAAKDELNKIVKNGPDQTDLDKWRAAYKTSFETNIKTNDFWMSYLTAQVFGSGKLTDIDDYLNIVDAQSIASIQQFAKQYVNGDNFIRFVLMPETTVAKGR